MTRWAIFLGLAAITLAGLGHQAALGQGTERRMTPSLSYYQRFASFYEGEYIEAVKGFESESRSSVKTAQSRWIDSICYETMCGECYFQMGRLDVALQRFNNALEIFTRFSDWMTKVQFSQSIRPASAGARKPVPWGQSGRRAAIGSYPTSEKMLQGEVDLNSAVKRGGVVTPATYYPVTPHEIVRCTVLAMRRRAALLGPVCKQDQLSNDVIAAMARPGAPANSWSNCYVDLEHAMAMIAGGRDAQAISYLQRSVLAAGEFDHPLTSVALFELGRQSLLAGKYDEAAKFFQEVTYAAATTYSSSVSIFDYGILEEAFRYGTLTHLAANRKGLYPPLEPAIMWSKRNHLRQLHASLLLCAAENHAVLGNTRQAAAMLDEARTTIGRRVMGAGAIGARLNYLAALVAYQQKRVPEGNAALAAAIGYMQRGPATPAFRGKSGGSLRLFHIGLADATYVEGRVTPRGAMDLFNEVLRDPRPSDWSLDPLETLSTLMTPHPIPFEHWFEAVAERGGVKDVASAIEIAERTRRHRFFTSLEFGGRLESLRWTLEAPRDWLSQESTLQRQDLSGRFSEYTKLSERAKEIRAALVKKPPVADSPASVKEQSRQLSELGAIGAQQEAVLREMALRRQPASLVFPPLIPLADIQKSLPPKAAALAFFASGRHLYGFLLNNDQCKYWQVASSQALAKQIQSLLRDLGQYGANHEFSVKDLTETKWKQSGRQVLDTLLKGSPADFSQAFEELAIVPDGILWYLPFEALQVKVDGRPQSLLSRFRIRYAPTLSLCVPLGSGRNRPGNTAIVLGKLNSTDKEESPEKTFDQLSAVMPGAVMLKPPMPASSSLYAALFQRLVVLDDITPSEAPFGWRPISLDRSKSGGTLADWMTLPWGKPDIVLLPGFHTATEDGLKRMRRGSQPGSEMFLSTCGLMATGARTVLVSRWRTGGQSSLDLVREFAQELPQTSAADAWQRAVLVEMDSRLNLDSEPRIKRGPVDESPKASHPFFWSGYMVIDCCPPPQQETKPREPAVKPKKH
ncbi:MAG: CHAT domain-containing protein [Thermoguttaceae bacterium]